MPINYKKPRGIYTDRIDRFYCRDRYCCLRIIIALSTALMKTPTANHQLILTQLANERMELFLGQRRLKGLRQAQICASERWFTGLYIRNLERLQHHYIINERDDCGDANYKQFAVIANRSWQQ